jgi:hypothetical protein
VTPPTTYPLTLLPGASALLAAHARELPQRDELCGAFCGLLALRAAGVEEHGGEPLDQDAVAAAAGTVLALHADPSHLPAGETGRRDYRLQLPRIENAARSGTTAAGVVRAVEALSGGALAAIPLAGPWTRETLGALYDALAAAERPVAAIANLATRYLWGARLDVLAALTYLDQGEHEGGPPPDWEVGHFVSVVGRVSGPKGDLYAIADTYPSLGAGGVHLQPAERLAAALTRPEGPAGGVVAVVDVSDAPRVRAATAAAGLREGSWDNGTAAPQSVPAGRTAA